MKISQRKQEKWGYTDIAMRRVEQNIVKLFVATFIKQEFPNLSFSLNVKQF